MEELAPKIKKFRLAYAVSHPCQAMPEYEEKIRKLPVDVVFDHMGLFPADMPITHPDFRIRCVCSKEATCG